MIEQHYRNRNRRSGSGGGSNSNMNWHANNVVNRQNMEDDSPRTVYVSNLHNDITNEAIVEAFSQYGTVESIMRRSVNFELSAGSGQQYAFVRFRGVKDARYAIDIGDIMVQGRKLSVRPRDKPTNSPGNNRSPKSFLENPQSPDRIVRMLNQSAISTMHPTQVSAIDPVMYRHAGPASGHFGESMAYQQEQNMPIQMMSRILTVTGIPLNMLPRDLYHLFSQFGLVEGVYIFPQPDPHGKRFAQVCMANFHGAQKATESLHGMYLQNAPYPLQITCRPSLLYNFIGGHHPAMPVQVQAFLPPPPAYDQYHHSFPVPDYSMPRAVHSSEFNMTAPQVFPPSYTGAFIEADPNVVGIVHQNPELCPVIQVSQAQNGATSRCVSGSSSTTLVNSTYEASASVKAPANDSTLRADTRPPVDGILLVPKGQQEANNKLEPLGEKGEAKQPDEATSKPSANTNISAASGQHIPETAKPSDPCNLYVKNLDDAIIFNTEDLKNVFSEYGQIASAFLATFPGSGISRGFGFVAFANAADASRAKAALDSQVVGRKRIFISYAERKEDRKQRLKKLFGGLDEEQPPATPEVSLKEAVILDPQFISTEKVKSPDTSRGVTQGNPESAAENYNRCSDDAFADDKSTGTVVHHNRKNSDAHSEDSFQTSESMESQVTESTEAEVPDAVEEKGNSKKGQPAAVDHSTTFSTLEIRDDNGAPLKTEQKVIVTTTVTTTKAWRGTPLHKIPEIASDGELPVNGVANEQAKPLRGKKAHQGSRFRSGDRSVPEYVSNGAPTMPYHQHSAFMGSPSMIPIAHEFRGGSQGGRRGRYNHGRFNVGRQSTDGWFTKQAASNMVQEQQGLFSPQNGASFGSTYRGKWKGPKNNSHRKNVNGQQHLPGSSHGEDTKPARGPSNRRQTAYRGGFSKKGQNNSNRNIQESNTANFGKDNAFGIHIPDSTQANKKQET